MKEQNQYMQIHSLMNEIEGHLELADTDKSPCDNMELAKQALQALSPAKANQAKKCPIPQESNLVNIINEIAKGQPKGENDFWIQERKERMCAIPDELKELCNHSFFYDTPATMIQAKMNESIISKSCGEIEKVLEETTNFYIKHDLKVWGIVGRMLVGIKALHEKVKKEKEEIQNTIARLIVQDSLGNDKPFSIGSDWLQFFDDEEKAIKCLSEMVEIQEKAKTYVNIQDLLKTFAFYANREKYESANCGETRMHKILANYGISVNQKAFNKENVIKAFENKNTTSEGQ